MQVPLQTPPTRVSLTLASNFARHVGNVDKAFPDPEAIPRGTVAPAAREGDVTPTETRMLCDVVLSG